ncbi:thioredoxin [Alteromonas halophila]|uniref:Thioredoxin n=2 Tax=Alteromonas halophila TaxID=516698 RepID=A0A918N1Y4_9ALTE|nr:thioredoxin [Alteromonas halophila]
MVVGVLTYQQTQPDFETLSGESYRWEEFKGQWLVVNYFAEWCAPCLREMPELNALAADMPENSRVFTLNYDLKGREALRKMASDYNIEVAMIVAEKNTPLPVPRPSYLPATYIVGPDGDIRKTMMGEVTEAGIRDALGKLQSQSL